MITAVTRTLLAGGTRTITDYLGWETAAEEYNRLAKLGWKYVFEFLVDVYRTHPSYLFLFTLLILFAVTTRAFGILGLVRATSNPRCHAHTVFYLLMVLLLLALCGLQGWSRYRAPMEPILMLFTVTALSRSINRDKN